MHLNIGVLLVNGVIRFATVVQACCEDYEHATAFSLKPFTGIRGALRDTIRLDETVQNVKK
jgi:hypothetical protein